MNDPASPKFSELVAQDSKDETSIVNDITRVFPTHPFFRQLNGVGQRSLYAVLKAYSNKDPSVGNKGTGYCQGMGFVAGLCLLYMPDKEAFWLLARLLKKYNLGQIFAPDLAGLRLWLYQLDRLMEVRMPELFAHLREEGLESSIFATKWFQTLFIYSLPMRYACRIFDVFLLEGPLVLFTVSLAILDAAIEMDGLLDKNFEQMMDYLNGVPAVLRPVSFHDIAGIWVAFFSRCQRYRCQQDPGPGEAGEEGEGREGAQTAAPAEGSAVAEARISPGQLLERAAAIKLDYAELQGCAQMAALPRLFWVLGLANGCCACDRYERTFVRTEEPVAGAFSIW